MIYPSISFLMLVYGNREPIVCSRSELDETGFGLRTFFENPAKERAAVGIG
jgi:hypothetical protein